MTTAEKSLHNGMCRASTILYYIVSNAVDIVPSGFTICLMTLYKTSISHEKDPPQEETPLALEANKAHILPVWEVIVPEIVSSC